MEIISVVDQFFALAQVTRLEVFRLLVQHVPNGLAAGEIARRLAVPHNTLSSHLAVLSDAKLIQAQRQGRHIIYHADLKQLRQLVLYLLQDCCGGNRELCAPIIACLSSCGEGQGSSCASST